MKKFLKSNLLNEGYSSTQLVFDRAEGSYVYVNKKRYIDLSNGAGTVFLGHNNKVFKNSLRNYLKSKLSNFAHPNKAAYEFSKTLKKVFPEFSKFILCSTGAEANLKAIRVARAISKKNLIVNVTGSWHGSVDQLLFHSDSNLKKKALSEGLDSGLKKNLIYVPYNSIKKTRIILNRVKKRISCVIIEPIQGGLPTENCINYLKFLSDFCKKNKIILILDEILSGVRFNCSSIQSIYKIHAPISTFGKILGGSLPIGIIGIKKDIVKKISKNKKKIFFGGTYSGNSLTCFVGNETLKFIIKNKKKIFSKIENTANLFGERVNKFLEKNNIDAKLIRFQSLMRIILSKKNINNRVQRDFFEEKKLVRREKFVNFLKSSGIYFPSNGVITISYSLTKIQLNYLVKKTNEALKKYFK